MNPETEHQATEYTPAPAEFAAAEKPPIAVNTVEAGALSKLPNTTTTEASEWQKLAQEKLYWLLTEFPDQFNEFFGEYRKPLTAAGITLAAIPFVALAAAILDVINTIPLFAATFELIGVGFTGWFIYRYLLFADRRQEFSGNIEGLKGQILGQKSTDE